MDITPELHELNVLFFDAYCLLHQAAELALEFCEDGNAAQAAKVLSETLVDVRETYSENIEKYLQMYGLNFDELKEMLLSF